MWACRRVLTWVRSVVESLCSHPSMQLWLGHSSLLGLQCEVTEHIMCGGGIHGETDLALGSFVTEGWRKNPCSSLSYHGQVFGLWVMTSFEACVDSNTCGPWVALSPPVFGQMLSAFLGGALKVLWGLWELRLWIDLQE